MATKISISGIIKAYTEYGKEFGDAYCFVKDLRSFEKHNIIKNIHSQLPHLPKLLDIGKNKFNRLLRLAIRFKLAYMEGNHLRLLSNKQDKEFKPSKHKDYRITKNTAEFVKITLIEHYEKKQIRGQKHTEKQNVQSVLNKGAYQSLTTYNNNEVNKDITASCRGIAKLFGYKSADTGMRLIKEMKAKGYIEVTPNIIRISKEQFRECLTKKMPNIRYKDGQYLFIKASKLKVIATTKRKEYVKPTQYDYLPNNVKDMYEAMGLTVFQINQLLKANI